MITVDKNAAYPVAIETLKSDETLVAETELRQSKYLNNVIEQDQTKHQANRETDDGIQVFQYGTSVP